MALSFITGSITLSSWGFGAGDIAVIAGAGRAVGNWVMAQRRDRALLEFLQLQPEDILQRKGLMDTIALHNRWDKKLTLLKNGRLCTIENSSTGTIVENMDAFTWFMSLLVATLDAAVSSKLLKELIVQFLADTICDKTTGSADYLVNEAQQHIMGWRSSATVRSISHTARGIWQRLAREHRHLPGEIPRNDSGEILRFLMWVASDSSTRHITTSTDVMCLAHVLGELGLDLLVTNYNGGSFDENRLVVSLSTLPLIKSLTLATNGLTKRHGMRIPLDDLKESVSLWPGDGHKRNQYRAIFTCGARAAEGVKLVICEKHYSLDEEEIDVYYTVQQSTKLFTTRAEGNNHTILDHFVLAPTIPAAKLVAKLTSSWPSRSREQIGHWVGELCLNQNTEEEIGHFELATKICLAELQIFLLGYWYTILLPLVDVSQLPVQEAYGSWGWTDIQVPKAIRRLTLSKDPDDGRIPRFEVLRLLGYLLAGAEYDEQLLPLRRRSAGVLGKLALVTASLMGGADTPEKVGRFFLLDVDASCIPSNSRGIILCGLRKPCPKVAPQGIPQTISQTLAESPCGQGDFSSHIEPDWGYDAQRVLIAYRDGGRMVHRISPVDGDIAVLTSWVPPVRQGHQGTVRAQQFTGATIAKLTEYHGGVQVRQPDLNSSALEAGQFGAERPEASELGIVVLTKSLPKARTCILSMYGAGVAVLCSDNFAKAAEDSITAAFIA
ncbi:hypothetical protein MMC13_001281 [Lambiella insularis]|nr:hypothetical protein [Lambiella insularis]